jgi:hypothetical protein
MGWSLLAIQVILCLRALLDHSDTMGTQMVALSCLLEPALWTQTESAIVEPILAGVLATNVTSDFNTVVKAAFKPLFIANVHAPWVLLKTHGGQICVDELRLPRTFSTTVWTFFRCYPASSFPLVTFCLEHAQDFQRVAKLVKLMSFMRMIEPLLVPRTCTLFLLLHNLTFFHLTERLSFQELAFAHPIWLATFGKLFPFGAVELGKFPNCSDQLNYAAQQICEFQEFVASIAAPFVSELHQIPVPFARFMPIMSLARVSVSAFLQSAAVMAPADAELPLRALFAGPIATFTHERFVYEDAPPQPPGESPDFLGLCNCDWRRGLAGSAGPVPSWTTNELFQTPLQRRFAFLTALLGIFDADVARPSVARERVAVESRAMEHRRDSNLARCFEPHPLEMTATDARAKWAALLPEATRAAITVVPTG